ncbi:glutamate racemase [Prochlorococcus sp. MIT 1300]|uniref:glutamate racemase n=1 Tax=Prochlorococcus sp. MIT 1300 TaxID=3096218 RepID=UPI002A74B600|nr:glutamate racemase [Prochlorococcus sp. MIT 1300]
MNLCLGLFDSGIGGFTVLRKVLDRHYGANCVYLGDTARVPYGERDVQEIREIAMEVVSWLVRQKVSVIAMACNTTNSLAFDVVKETSGIPVVDLISSISETIEDRKIGVLATPATAASGVYRQQIEYAYPGTEVWEQSCPSLVPLIEAKTSTGEELRAAALEYLTPLLNKGVEAIILGCTHYPLLECLLRDLLPEDVKLLDPAMALARKLDTFLGTPERINNRQISLANTRICVTSDPSLFADRATEFFGMKPEVELVSLRS